jgi:hypothetical protein|mmetsp:Transcript_32842/g.53658  ORF Transcript_32842/g.53658 Transcript_32842/m.53658 type:complete len:87 (-) Transcript_32842:2296-2556(-)
MSQKTLTMWLKTCKKNAQGRAERTHIRKPQSHQDQAASSAERSDQRETNNRKKAQRHPFVGSKKIEIDTSAQGTLKNDNSPVAEIR